MVVSAWASAALSGPTTRSVDGADVGDADVGGGGGGCLSLLVQAPSAKSTAAMKLTTPFFPSSVRKPSAISSLSSLRAPNVGHLNCAVLRFFSFYFDAPEYWT